MTPEEIDTLIAEQAAAYKGASRRYGVGPTEKAVIGEAGEAIKRGARKRFQSDGDSHEDDTTDERPARSRKVEDLRGGYGGAKAYGKSDAGLS